MSIRGTAVKNLIFVLALPPNRVLLQESLEAAMVAAVFDQQVSVLFRDAAVTCLLREDDCGSQSQVHDTLRQLPDYGANRIYACIDSLKKFGIEASTIEPDVKLLDRASQIALISSQDAVIPG